MHILDELKQISGLKLNINKTSLLRTESLKSSNIKYLRQLKFIWSKESAKTLGIVFSNDKSKMLENNLITKLTEFTNYLKRSGAIENLR